MTTVKINIPDQKAAVLKATAAAYGLTLEDWLQNIAMASETVGAVNWAQCPAVESIPGKVGGAWVFKDTRTPVSIVFENLRDGMTIDELIEQYPLTHEQIEAVLDFAAHSVAAPLVPNP